MPRSFPPARLGCPFDDFFNRLSHGPGTCLFENTVDQTIYSSGRRDHLRAVSISREGEAGVMKGWSCTRFTFIRIPMFGAGLLTPTECPTAGLLTPRTNPIEGLLHCP